MATNAFKIIHHNTLHKRYSINHPLPLSTTVRNVKFPIFLKQTTNATTICLSSTTISPVSTITDPTTSETVSFTLLTQYLSDKNYREADEETRRLLIVLAGEAAQSRGYVFFSETQFISSQDLKTIDSLWRKHSDNKFGYSVQKQIWEKSTKDFTNFFIKVGWMKLLPSEEVTQYNYKAFPNEFMWEMEEGTPEGHLPLTNALRGTQLLISIFNHPAFEDTEEVETGDGGGEIVGEKKEKSKGLLNGIFKTNYTF